MLVEMQQVKGSVIDLVIVQKLELNVDDFQ
jgi:hypothetical protein